MTLHALPWIVLFLPIVSAGLIFLFTKRNAVASAALSTAAVCIGFVFTAIYVFSAGMEPVESSRMWLDVAGLSAEFGVLLDPLSLSMMLVVTGVASLIHIYSWGYMKGDRDFARFFGTLSLFTFSMLGIVVANNFLQMFIFWELVGVSSYLLIGFWIEKPSAADAGKKAFITNRLGDFGFILGIFTVWAAYHSLNFEIIRSSPEALGSMATTAGLLIFCGAMGKSAQFPLHVWLPDAMEGPTPVSALIHAATMVAAGVYMLCRVLFLLNADALQVISWIGGITALLAALMAVQQNDIKRILAYSTLSQLGYMVMAVGLHGPTPAMFHLTTHAFFKALLFLGAGSVIIALHHEQDIWNMGGLRKKMPVTFWTFMAGTLALAGIVPFSGFYSKDAILAQAMHQKAYALFALAWIVAVLTAFYMFRLVFVVFYGDKRSESSGHAHESPPVVTVPLQVLAILSVVGGVMGIEAAYTRQFAGGEGHHAANILQQFIAPFIHAPVPALLGLVAAAIGFAVAYALYRNVAADPLPARLGVVSRWMRDRFYFDELYEATVIRAHDYLAAIADFIDRWIIAGVGVRGTHGTTELAGRALRLLQSGNLSTYAMLLALGVTLLLLLALY